MSFMLIVTPFAFIGQIVPIQRNLRILDVLLIEYDFVVHDVAQPFMAGFTHSSIDSLALRDVAGAA